MRRPPRRSPLEGQGARSTAPDPALDLDAWILWQDAFFVAVDKPAGVLSQGGEGGEGRNLVDLARARFARGGIGVLHRLDRNVSGIVLLALDPKAASGFSAALAKGAIDREYVAIVRGNPDADELVIDAALVKDSRTNQVRALAPGESDPDAKPARTEVSVERRLRAPLGACAVLSVRPITGRSHQIRAHLAHVGLPIIGDPKYGVAARGVRRPLLHARRMRFTHPITREPIDLRCAPPWTDQELTLLRRD